ncbi:MULTISPECIES: DUF927 domain-containing protein [Serratia]|uniref:DUF927 domain-containing protein n=1 Tax=Serratia TaxID=613 RepID=UPI000A8B5FAA|nr:DUF927 domain-containing protein [Serratia sp. 506_PEND]
MSKTKNDIDTLKHAASAPPDAMKPYYDVTDGGLYYVGVTSDRKSGAVGYAAPLRLCDALEIDGRGVNENGEHFRVVRWLTQSERREITLALPAADIGDREGWRSLKKNGLAISASRQRLELLADYLLMHGSKTLYHITDSGGWSGSAYILPSGEILGTPERPLLYNGDRSNAASYSASGSVEDWRRTVAALAQGNARAMLAIGCALAAPLLRLSGLESGGFHLFGDSGDGKTTSAAIGASVWGSPEGQKLSWDSTPLALSNAAAARNDGLMWLDEVGQGRADDVGLAAYRLFNGVGRMQGAKDGGNRALSRFKSLVFSTGEAPLNIFMGAGGKRIHAGQEARLPDIPADAGCGMGVWENLHGCASPGELAEALERHAQAFHGSAGRAFLQVVTNQRAEVTAQLRETLDAWRQKLPADASGQARRVTSRFGLVAVALEIAGLHGITGWPPGEATAAIERCYSAWRTRKGTGKQEDVRIVEQAEDWFALNALGRFVSDEEAKRLIGMVTVQNAAGRRTSTNGRDVYLVFRGAFDSEIARGFEPSKAAKVLHEAGMLKRDNNGKYQVPARMPGHNKTVRVYAFMNTTAQDGGEPEE